MSAPRIGCARASSGAGVFWALKDVSFDLYPGESLGVVGRNGCGKSTLLKILAGITRPDKGSISGEPLSATLLALQLGFLPYLTGRENAMLSGMMLGLTRSGIAERIEAIAEFAELGDFFDEPIAEYSAGMRARLGFAVAFQLDPDILLIDEVLGVGDAQFRERVRRGDDGEDSVPTDRGSGLP